MLLHMCWTVQKRNALFDVAPHVLDYTKKRKALFDFVLHVLDYTKKKKALFDFVLYVTLCAGLYKKEKGFV